MKIKAGPKGRHIEIPDGFEVIVGVHPQLGDKFLLCPTYDRWIDVDQQDVDDDFSEYDCLIRPINKERR